MIGKQPLFWMAASALIAAKLATPAIAKFCDPRSLACKYTADGGVTYRASLPTVALPASGHRHKGRIAGGSRPPAARYIPEIALKSAESAELGNVWYITRDCKSFLRSTPEVEVVDGPPNVTATIAPAKVTPHAFGCTGLVEGGKLFVTAKDIQEYAYTRLVLRINFKTLEGNRQRSENVNIALFPSASVAVALAANGQVNTQIAPRQFVIKNGETIELHQLWYVNNCHSVMNGLPQIEVLEGPSELSLSIREEPVLPRRLGCTEKVPGGTLLLTAKGVTSPFDAKLTYRVNYKTKDGPRQTGHTYLVSLFP